MSRLAVLTDIHGNLPALEAVITDARARGCDAFVNLGDSLLGPLWPAETADLLIAQDWPTIAGNHERQLLTLGDRMGASDRFTHARLAPRHFEWLAGLPMTLVIDGILLCHGTPRGDLEHFLQTVEPVGIRPSTEAEIRERCDGHDVPLILCGHSHIPEIAVLADGRQIANPGSVGLQAFHDDHPVAYQVEVGDPRARYAIVDHGVVELVAIDYDHESAAAKAEREGVTVWARALRTGQV